MRNYLKLGDWNTICDRCGFKFKASQLKQEWTGLMVCEKDWEMRNPLDLIRIPNEHIAPPWSRPEATDAFTTGEAYFTEDGFALETELELVLYTEG